jgi:hypothetical protein
MKVNLQVGFDNLQSPHSGVPRVPGPFYTVLRPDPLGIADCVVDSTPTQERRFDDIVPDSPSQEFAFCVEDAYPSWPAHFIEGKDQEIHVQGADRRLPEQKPIGS